MKLQDILNKLKGTDNEPLIEQINNAVSDLKVKALAGSEKNLTEKEKEILTLNETINKLTLEKNENTIKGLVDELIGDNETKSKLLIKLTDLNGINDKDKIKKAFENTIKDYKDIFESKKAKAQEPEKVDFEEDTTIDNINYQEAKAENKSDNTSNNVNNAFTGSK